MEIVLCMTVELVDYSGSDYLLKIGKKDAFEYI